MVCHARGEVINKLNSVKVLHALHNDGVGCLDAGGTSCRMPLTDLVCNGSVPEQRSTLIILTAMGALWYQPSYTCPKLPCPSLVTSVGLISSQHNCRQTDDI